MPGVLADARALDVRSAVIGFGRTGDRTRGGADGMGSADGPPRDGMRRNPASTDRVAAAKRGDDDAFGELVRAFEPDVARLCRRILGDTEDARDAAQDCFVRTHAALDSYDAERPFRPWLLGIAAHRAVDALRRRRREATLFSGEDLDAELHADPGASPLQHGLSVERRRELLDAIDALPDPYRAALTLRYFADLEFDEIARILDVSRNQVATLLFRGRRRLRDTLAAPGEESA